MTAAKRRKKKRKRKKAVVVNTTPEPESIKVFIKFTGVVFSLVLIICNIFLKFI